MRDETQQEYHDQPMLLSTNYASVLQEPKALRELPADGMAVKRAMDVVISGIAFVILLPVMILIALLVKLTSPGPIFFRWNVIGKGGQPFVGYKFRTMLDGADRIREQLREKNEMTGVFFKMRNDPRVTPIGRILRRFSLDELPQLWSVFKGDMSLVGPRPTQIFEYQQLKDWQKQRVKVKPGSVSLWIVSGKTTDFDQMIRLDLEYIDSWSIGLDLKILLKAFPYVVFGKNS
ncbi:MAG TPA: sugar transferase [Terriglobia bacterium]|nr:sugar transferase [Candidatus Acidoferrum sp.]HMD85298.1 sugar transferase [Terriglobia bacterium]